MTEHRGRNQNRKGQSTNIIVFFRKKHGQETLEHIKKQAQQPERYPAIYKYVCRTGIPVRAELCYIFFCEQQRHESAKHNSAAGKAERRICRTPCKRTYIHPSATFAAISSAAFGFMQARCIERIFSAFCLSSVKLHIAETASRSFAARIESP